MDGTTSASCVRYGLLGLSSKGDADLAIITDRDGLASFTLGSINRLIIEIPEVYDIARLWLDLNVNLGVLG